MHPFKKFKCLKYLLEIILTLKFLLLPTKYFLIRILHFTFTVLILTKVTSNLACTDLIKYHINTG